MEKKLRVVILIILILGIVVPIIESRFFTRPLSNYLSFFCSLIAFILLCIDSRNNLQK